MKKGFSGLSWRTCFRDIEHAGAVFAEHDVFAPHYFVDFLLGQVDVAPAADFIILYRNHGNTVFAFSDAFIFIKRLGIYFFGFFFLFFF